VLSFVIGRMSQSLSRSSRRISSACRLCALVAILSPSAADAQLASTSAAAPAAPVATVPEAIYWKQNLFLIPYQWSSAADPGAAQAVWLLVSKDRGATWQKISEARPQVKAFNYHAEGDGDYCFALRTIDRYGQPQPPGPYQPELRVVVDTTMPRIESVAAQCRADGALQIQWRAFDANLDPNSWKFEVQLDGSDTWQPLGGLVITPLSPLAAQSTPGVNEGQAIWQPPQGARPRALRATVYDRAGNSAAYGAATTGPPVGSAVVSAPANPAAPATPEGWVSSSDPRPATPQPSDSAATQPWPAGAIARSPFRLSDSAAPSIGDQVTSYGNPPGVGTPLVINNNLVSSATGAGDGVGSADGGELSRAEFAAGPDPENRNDEKPAGPTFTPLEPYREPAGPFRQASLTRLPSVDGSPTAPIAAPPLDSPIIDAPAQPRGPQLPPGIEPKHVGSRTFALEYDLEDFGRGGIARVTLWGSSDGGQTWRSFAADADHRSPLVVTVDDAGLYGFRIVVESAGGSPAIPPRAGDAPELWVDVDLDQPSAELTSVQLGSGNLSDHLILKWHAEDDDLAARPIALFYSSRPAGPWTAVATNLANTGEYAWQLQRYLPDRIYLRLEARDAAGNLAAYQTREPVLLPPTQPSARLRDAESLGPTAVSRSPLSE
jgi:hypothetical protein